LNKEFELPVFKILEELTVTDEEKAKCFEMSLLRLTLLETCVKRER